MTRRRWPVLVAFAIGVALWWVLPLGIAGEHERCPLWRWGVALAAGVLGAVVARVPALSRMVKRFNLQSPRKRAVIAVCVAVAASLYFLFTAVNQDRDFFPLTHDECSYAI